MHICRMLFDETSNPTAAESYKSHWIDNKNFPWKQELVPFDRIGDWALAIDWRLSAAVRVLCRMQVRHGKKSCYRLPFCPKTAPVDMDREFFCRLNSASSFLCGWWMGFVVDPPFGLPIGSPIADSPRFKITGFWMIELIVGDPPIYYRSISNWA